MECDHGIKNQIQEAIPFGRELKIVGRVISEGNRSFEGTGEIVLTNGEIAVSAEEKYMKVDIKRIAGESRIDDDWFFVDSPDDPAEI